eukprot:CFRG1725T1
MVFVKKIFFVAFSALATTSIVDGQTTECRYQGQSFQTGDIVEGNTLTCICRNGKWRSCTANPIDMTPSVSPTPSTTPSASPTPSTTPPETNPGEQNENPFGTRVGFNPFIDNFIAEDFVFDFADESQTTIQSSGSGGTVQSVNINRFPVLQTADMAFTRFHIAPCGINLPHVHPRATESIYMVDGELTVGFTTEGGRVIINDISAEQSTFFPQGLLHYQQNLGCEPASFISILNNADPGVVTIPSALMSLPGEALEATFEEDASFIEQLKLGLPAGPGRGRAECLRRCRLPCNTPLA